MDTTWKMNKHQKHAKLKKSDTEVHIVYNSVYVKCSEETNLYTECRLVVSWGWDWKQRWMVSRNLIREMEIS